MNGIRKCIKCLKMFKIQNDHPEIHTTIHLCNKCTRMKNCKWCLGTGIAHDYNMIPGETAICPCPDEAQIGYNKYAQT